MATVLKDLLLDSKDGEWGGGEPTDDSVEMLAIRGTDFDEVRLGSVAGVPLRYIPSRIAVRKTLQPLDIVFETAGGSKDRPTGRSVLLKEGLFQKAGSPLTCASFARFLRIDPRKAEPEYVFWLLQYMYNAGILKQYHTQHTGVARYQYTAFAENQLLNLPSRDKQCRIASLLSAYDDLIGNNTRRIAILEEIARRIYEEWFVRFRFPGHESVRMVESEIGLAPEGWRAVPITSVGAFKYGKGLPTKQLVDGGAFPVYGASKIIGYYNEYTRPERTLIVGCRGTVGVPLITLPQCFVTNNSFTADPLHPAGLLWLYLTVRCRGLKDVVGGAAQPQITLNSLSGAIVLNPPARTIDQFDAVVRPIFELAWILGDKNRNLRITRDLLLPKLISGELDVSELPTPKAIAA